MHSALRALFEVSCTSRAMRRAVGAAPTIGSVCLVLMLTFSASPTQAQSGDSRFEVGGGLQWFGPTAYPRASADEQASGGAPRPLFVARGQLEPSAGAALRVGVRLLGSVQLESSFAYHATRLSMRITDDAEGASGLTVSAPVTQYLVEGGVSAPLRRWQSGRFQPFVSAGIGYVRHLSGDRALVETGSSGYAGGGLRYFLAPGGRGRLERIGIRVDARANLVKGGVALDRSRHVVPSVGASFFARF